MCVCYMPYTWHYTHFDAIHFILLTITITTITIKTADATIQTPQTQFQSQFSDTLTHRPTTTTAIPIQNERILEQVSHIFEKFPVSAKIKCANSNVLLVRKKKETNFLFVYSIQIKSPPITQWRQFEQSK